MNSEKLIQAVQLIKSGNKQAALPLLKEVVQADPNNENAWLWLYSCVENTEQKKYCLQQALRINPDNPHAHSALLKLENLMSASLNLSHQSPQLPVRETRHPTPVSTTRVTKPYSSPKKKQVWWLWVSGVTILICVGFSLAGVLLSNVGWFEQIPLFAVATNTSTPTNVPTGTFTPTFSPTPTNTNTPTLTPTSTIIPTAPLHATLLTLSELNSVTSLGIWLYEGVPVEHLELIPEIATSAKGSIEHISSSWDGNIVLNGDSAMQIHMQRWQTETEAENAIALYKSAHDLNFESIKKIPGVIIVSSNTLELTNGKLIIDLLGLDYLNPVAYTAMIHYSNVSFTIQAVFPRTNIDYGNLIRKYINLQITKLQENGYR